MSAHPLKLQTICLKKLKIKVVEKNNTMKAFLINLVDQALKTTSLPNPEVKKSSIPKSLRNKGQEYKNIVINKMREDLSI